MKNLKLASIALILTSGLAHAQSFGKLNCAGKGNSIQVSVSLHFKSQDHPLDTFKLRVQKEGEFEVDTIGNAEVSGGDGMYWATLSSTSEDGTQTKIGKMEWWIVPSITPRITLTESTDQILMKCKKILP